MNFVDFEWPVWPGPHYSRHRERAQSISESSQHALCTGLPVTQKTVPWIWRLTISSVKMTEGFPGGAGVPGRSAAHSYLCAGSWHARCLLLLLFYWFFPLFSLPPPLPPSQINPADGPGWPIAGTREAPLPHKGMNGWRQSTFTAETRKHCWAERYHVKHLQYQALNST